MSKFIGLNIARLDDNDQIYRTGSVLLNVERIVSIEAHGPPRKDSLCRIQTVNDPDPFIVEGSMIDLLDVIKRAGADFYAFDNKKTASQRVEQGIKVLDFSKHKSIPKLDPKIVKLFDDLLIIYGRHAKIAHKLRDRFQSYNKLRVHSLTERLKRLQVNHEKLDTVSSRRHLVNDLEVLLSEAVVRK